MQRTEGKGRWFPCPKKECGISLLITNFDADTQCRECKTIFRYLECPYFDCDQTLLYNHGEFVPGKRYKCFKCKRGFQRINCPQCRKIVTFMNKPYVEGTIVTCTHCTKTFQQVSCGHCRKCITYPDCSYRQGSVVNCPYQECKKRFQHVICPHCVKNVVFVNCDFKHGLRQTCPYRQDCGKQFQMINCSHCQRSVFFPNCDYVEGKVHKCNLSNCNKEFQMLLCGYCQGSIFFKRCDYKLGSITKYPYPHCQKQFQQMTCPNCSLSIVFKGCNYSESKKLKCPYQHCGKEFQQKNCPHCSRPMAWRNGDYYEGEFVKCCYKDCGKLYQHINCPHCKNTIIWKEANKSEKDLQQCPYQNCQKKFFHFNCNHCRRPIVVNDWKRFLPGSQLKCPYSGCEKVFAPSMSPSHLLDKVPKNTIFFPSDELTAEELVVGGEWTFEQFLNYRDEPFTFLSSEEEKENNNNNNNKKAEKIMMIPLKDVIRKVDGMTGHPIIIGTGSFGTVFPARVRGHSAFVKEIHVGGSLSEEDVEREIKEVRSIKHPFLLTPLGYCFPSENILWLVMLNSIELNTSLRELLFSTSSSEKKKKKVVVLTWFEKWFLLRKMAESLRVLHRNEVVHRDVKLSNFLISKNRRVMKLSDFGMGQIKACARRQTSGRLRPYAGSLAPELLTPNPRPTLQSDIYALGMCFYEVVVGRPPYDVGEAQTFMLIKQGNLPDVPREVPRMFGELIKWCWVRDPNERPSCDEIITFLKENEIPFVDEYGCENEKLELPLIFTCPLSMKLMEDPSMLKETKEVFEKVVITDWLKTSKTDPMTGKEIRFQIRLPEVTLKNGIDSWRKKCFKEKKKE